MLLRACVAGSGGRGGRGTLDTDVGSGCGRLRLERVEAKALAHFRVAALADQLGGFLLGGGHLCYAQIEQCMHLFAAGAAVYELKLARGTQHLADGLGFWGVRRRRCAELVLGRRVDGLVSVKRHNFIECRAQVTTALR